jgi:hypothetical protein
MDLIPRFLDVPSTSTGVVRPKDLKGLRSFRHDYPESATVLLYRGTERLSRDGTACIPVDEFLRQLVPGRDPWPQPTGGY